jgi:glycosyltransferase involved in cell wall biosynthesis
MVLTVSDFSRVQIQKMYKVPDNRIEVIPNGWEHFKDVDCEAILDNDGFLLPGSFYFTLGSLQKRKNLGWIAKYAAAHPEEKFAISGKAVSGFVSGDIAALQTLPNVKLLGYVTDAQVKWLMKNCKAFVFPSYYEGFGIPPLEALSVGAKIIVGNAASLPEIYKTSAAYIDPYNPECDLSDLLTHMSPDCNQVSDAVLKEYTYDKAAQKLYNILNNKF